MTREQYIENIKGRLDELTKAELKDVSMLTAAQLKVRQAVVEKESLMNDITALKSQCEDAKKQQPEIPECVAEFIENYDDINETSLLYIMKDFVESKHWEVFCKIPDDLKKYGRWEDMLYKAIRFGYIVAKEKRFYLKHKSVLIFDPDSDDSDVEELYLGAGGNFVPYKHLAKTFTQQEIDSMETGSYEQIEVEE